MACDTREFMKRLKKKNTAVIFLSSEFPRISNDKVQIIFTNDVMGVYKKVYGVRDLKGKRNMNVISSTGKLYTINTDHIIKVDYILDLNVP